jgi:coproporphyrinogen III oxidase-like Fe-S oxidoreductase
MVAQQWTPTPINETWWTNRTALQKRYAEVSELIDASRFAYLRGTSKVWTEEEIADVWRSALAKPISETDSHNNCYVHVPFCKSICTFCNYERLRPSSTDLLEQYMNRIERSIETLAPAVKSIQFHSLYFGGGTPSILPPKILDRILTRLDNALNWHPQAGRHFEFDPAVMSNEKTEILASHGFEHFSFGIQALDPNVNDKHNRGPQDLEMVGKRFQSFYEQGLYDVSCDILLGLEGTSPATTLQDIETLLTKHQPRRIDIFSLTPTHSYVDRHFGGSFDAFWAHLKPFQEDVIPRLPELAEKTGYLWFEGNGHHMMLERGPSIVTPKMHTKSQFSYNALAVEVKRPIHILGFGQSARSQIFGYAAMQSRDPDSGDGPSYYVGHAANREIEIRTYLAHFLRDTNKIDRETFKRIFGIDITEAIPLALAAWKEEGLLQEVTEKEVRLQEQLRMDRTKSLVWIVPDEYLEYEVARRERLDLSPGSLEGMLYPLEPGMELAGRYTYTKTEQSRILLDGADDTEKVVLRVAPDLASEKRTVRLILETRPPKDPVALQALKKAVGQITKLLNLRHAEILSHRPSEEDRRNERAPAYSTEISGS